MLSGSDNPLTLRVRLVLWPQPSRLCMCVPLSQGPRGPMLREHFYECTRPSVCLALNVASSSSNLPNTLKVRRGWHSLWQEEAPEISSASPSQASLQLEQPFSQGRLKDPTPELISTPSLLRPQPTPTPSPAQPAQWTCEATSRILFKGIT